MTDNKTELADLLASQEYNTFKRKQEANAWKRMGLGFVNGEDGTPMRQRKSKDKELAHQMGYNPERRSIMFNVVESFIKANSVPYKEMYNNRKAYEQQRVETKLHAHRAAHRFVAQKFLRHLLAYWNTNVLELGTIGSPSGATIKTMHRTRASGRM